MFSYSPKLPELIFYPILGWAVSLGITRTIPAGEWQDLAKFGYYAMCVNCAFVASFYLYRDACQFFDSATPSQAGTPKDERPTQADPQRIPMTVNGNQVYSQELINIKVDCVKLFNQTLIDQKVGGLEINLTEDFWLKKHGSDESRWVTAGGVGRADFIDMLERGLLWHAYKKVGGQGKRVPDQWRKIQQLAQGYPLPQHDQLPKA